MLRCRKLIPMFIGIHPVEKSQDNTVGIYIDPDCNETFLRPGRLLSVATSQPLILPHLNHYTFL